MTDKKFTDEEIIETLECHINAEDCVGCEKFGRCDEIILTELVLDLINRQKAEIARLKECPKCVYEYDGEITEYCVQGPCSNFKTVEQIKAEAYKEFAERLKGEIKREKESGDELLSEIYDRDVQMNAEGEKMAFDSVERIVDNLLKEMVGEEE